MARPLVIGISGGSGSGKTRLIEQLRESFQGNELTILSMDNYYKPIDQQPTDINGIENFDLPDSLDVDKIYQDFTKLMNGESVSIKTYTFNNKSTESKEIKLFAAKVLIIEGIFCFYFKQINSLLNLRLFMEAPDYLMLSRRIVRDAQERGYDMDDVLYRFKHHVIPSYNQFIAPLKQNADIIIPNYTDFTSALDMLKSHIKFHLKEY